jgi:ABC-2 type transport system ATP-binding protein
MTDLASPVSPAGASVASPTAGGGAPAIEAVHLTKNFGAFPAVQDLTFSIYQGELVAFLGPNGAGKSTTMRMLTGYLAPSTGVARIAGVNVEQDRVSAARHVGYLPENGPLYPDMTPMETLRFAGRARGLAGRELAERIEVVAAQCRLGEVIERPVGKLSKGYRQRVGMAVALLHRPGVLILDEPTAGLDPNQVDQVRTLLKDLSKSCTILLSTHILSEVRALADRIILINRGRLVHDGGPSSLGSDEAAMEERFRNLTR